MRTLASHCRLSLPGASPSMPIGARTGPVSVSEPASIRAMRGRSAGTRRERLGRSLRSTRCHPGDRLHDVDPVDAGGQPHPVHYYGTEEVFFMFDGECLVRCWDGEET